MSNLVVQLELAVRNATAEAGKICKGITVDDIDYWDWYDQYDTWRAINRIGQYQQQDAHEGNDPRSEHGVGLNAGSRLRFLAYPRTLKSARMDARGYRDLQKVKRHVKSHGSKEDYNRWIKCNAFYVKRHELFVASLEDDAKVVYENMSMEDRVGYEKLQGYQKTNFVLRLLAARLLIHAEEEKNQAIAKLYSSTQRPNQSANEFISFVEKQRLALKRFGVSLPDETIRTVLMNGLNSVYQRAMIHYRYEECPLEDVKKTLRIYKFNDLLRHSPDQSVSRARGYMNQGSQPPKRFKRNHDKPRRNTHNNTYDRIPSDQYRRIVDRIRSQYKNYRQEKHGRNSTEDAGSFSKMQPRKEAYGKSSRSSTESSRKSRVECYKCHKLGHYAHECLSRGNRNGNNASSGVGAVTLEEDHYDQSPDQDAQSEASEDFWNSLVEDERYDEVTA